MEYPNLKIRAAIFDVYGTLLVVGAPPPDAELRWQRLFEEMLGIQPPLQRSEFAIRTSQVIVRQHARAKQFGIRWPEVNWPEVVLEVMPVLSRLSARKLDNFLLRQMQIGRSLRLANGAANCLRRMNEQGILLGIASNSQAYTLRELNAALQEAGLNLSMFERELCFWSFENGFSKPDPHVFRILSARLAVRQVRPPETLMVGDRFDNDIEPARAQGWQTWQLMTATNSNTVGGFSRLADQLG